MDFRKFILTLPLLLATLMPAASQTHSGRVAVIMAEFHDTPFTVPDEYADSVFSMVGKYFYDQMGPQDSVVLDRGPHVQLPESQDATAVALAVSDACRLADAEWDFSLYGCVCVIFSGESIWPRQYSLHDDNIYTTLDGRGLDSYIAMSEFFNGAPFSTGLLCHEYGHVLGLPDLYDTDGEASGGVSEALWGSLDLMDKGNDNDGGSTPAGFSAVDYDLLGIGQRDTLRKGTCNLEPVSKGRRYLWAPSDVDGECFLFECRADSGWDSAIGGSGMLIYHVDRSTNRSGFSTYYNMTLSALDRWTRKQVNCRPDHQCVDLLEAKMDAVAVDEVFFPYTVPQTFASDTDPAFRYWSGKPSRLAITDIRMEADSSVSFNVIEPIVDGKEYVFQESATLCWTIDGSLLEDIDSCSVTWSSAGRTICRDRMKVSSSGKTYDTVTGLEPNTDYTAEVMVYTGNATFSSSRSMKTRPADSRNTIPFIFLASAEKDDDGWFVVGSTFPLHVYNAIGAQEIRWTFDGKVPKLTDEGLFIVEGSGTLRAEVFYEDGSCDVITKEIMAR